MSKLRLVILAALLLLPAIAWSQNTGLTSLPYDFSFGVFWNELDRAANVGRDFATLGSDYLFGGLGNLNTTQTTSSFSSSFFDPLWLGYYHAGSLPWSVFAGVHHDDGPTANTSQTLYIGANVETVGTPPNTTDYTWYDQIAATEYTVPVFSEIDDSVQFLLDLGGLNIGVFLSVMMQNATITTANYTTIDTYQYDTAAAAAVPAPATDYTRTTTATDLSDGSGDPGITNAIFLGIPVYLKAIDASANLRVGYAWQDASTTYSRSFTNPVDPATVWPFLYTNTERNDTIIRTSTIPVQLAAEKRFAPLIGSHANDAFTVGVDAFAVFNSGTYADVLITQAYSYTAPGPATALARNWDTVDGSFAGSAGFGVDVNVRHAFYFDPAAGVSVGIVPRIDIGYSHEPAGIMLVRSVQVDRIDGNTDGAFNNALDTIETTTTEYRNTMFDWTGPIDEEIADVLSVEVSMPSALKFQILPWFGITLGAEPRLTGTFTCTKTTGATERETVVTADGTGVVASTVVTEYESGLVTNEKETDWSATVDHNLGVSIGIPGGIMLHVDVSAALFSGVWDFRALVIQGVIPLPGGAKKK